MKENIPDIFYHLITHKGFRDWVQKPSKENHYFWKKWMESHPDKLKELKKGREFIEKLHFQKERLSNDELEEILGKVIANEKPVSTKAPKWWQGRTLLFGQWLRVAAILLLTVVAAVVMHGIGSGNQEEQTPEATEWITMENPKGRKSKVTLPDGTKVDLNHESWLRFPKIFNGDTREVQLRGEAFFEVRRNDTLPFIVRTNTLETEVLGTSFNIKSLDEEQETEISLVTGKVKIVGLYPGSAEEDAYLSPGEQLSYNGKSGQIKFGKFNLDRVTAWKEGIIVFKDAGFEEFFDQLESWYGVDFHLHGSPSREWKINGRYQNEKLEDILIGLKFVYGLDYSIKGKNVRIEIK